MMYWLMPDFPPSPPKVVIPIFHGLIPFMEPFDGKGVHAFHKKMLRHIPMITPSLPEREQVL